MNNINYISDIDDMRNIDYWNKYKTLLCQLADKNNPQRYNKELWYDWAPFKGYQCFICNELIIIKSLLSQSLKEHSFEHIKHLINFI